MVYGGAAFYSMMQFTRTGGGSLHLKYQRGQRYTGGTGAMYTFPRVLFCMSVTYGRVTSAARDLDPFYAIDPDVSPPAHGSTAAS